MMRTVLLLAMLAAVVLGKECYSPDRPEDCYVWEEKWFEDMPIDHFSYGDLRTFRLRYLINTQWFTPGAPIFVYAGNELTIESFANNTGFMWDEAPRFNATLLFIEHRYYGKSLPFGAESTTKLENLQHLSSEQALADFAQVILTLKAQMPGMSNSPAIAFGGSYGAMLAAWLRIKYPHVVVGAVSSSGPIYYTDNLTPCWGAVEIITKDYKEARPGCDDMIRKSWPALRRLAKSSKGRDFLNNLFKVCPSSQLTTADDVSSIVGWADSALFNMAMLNYPYPTSFTKPLPTYPVTAACMQMSPSENPSDEHLATQLQKAISVYYNLTGQIDCLSSEAADGAFGPWPFQTCTEQTLPQCHNGTDMFEESKWDWQAVSDDCARQFWGVRPRQHWSVVNYGGKMLQWATNIIFINGDMDPWYAGGVTSPYPGMSPTVHIITIHKAAHHLEMRAENAADPIWTKNARKHIRAVLRQWAQFKF